MEFFVAASMFVTLCVCAVAGGMWKRMKGPVEIVNVCPECHAKRVAELEKAE